MLGYTPGVFSHRAVFVFSSALEAKTDVAYVLISVTVS